jgi:hypothetical protein
MATQAQRRVWRDAVDATLKERDRSERARLRRHELRHGPAAADRPRPLAFDALGFPIPQPTPSFARRVARLLREE